MGAGKAGGSMMMRRALSKMRDYSFGDRDVSKGVVGVFVVVWALLVIAPLVIIFVYSFFTTEYYSIVYKFTLDSWKSIVETHLWDVVVRTIRIAGVITVIELLVGYPFAVWLAKGCKSKSGQAVGLALLTVPFFLSISSKTMIWVPILGKHGLINAILMGTGLVSHPIGWLLFSEFSVYVGLFPLYFPTMVLPIFLSVMWIDDELIQASEDLGASPLQTLRNIIIPLSLPGVVGGIVLTFGPALGAWVVPTILGGSFVNLVSNAIQSAFSSSNYPVMSGLSALIIAFVLGCAGVMRLALRLRTKGMPLFSRADS